MKKFIKEWLGIEALENRLNSAKKYGVAVISGDTERVFWCIGDESGIQFLELLKKDDPRLLETHKQIISLIERPENETKNIC